MQKYNTPLAELIGLETKDIITLSAPDEEAPLDDVIQAGKLEGWFTKP